MNPDAHLTAQMRYISMVENDKSEEEEVIEGRDDLDENLTKAEEAKKVNEELREKTGRGAEPE
jgi:hypothetical protein